VDRGAAFGKAALLLGVVLVTFAAGRATIELDKLRLRPAALAFAAGVFLGALLLLFELLTDGAITRLAMNSVALLHPDKPKHLVILEGQVTKISLAEFNRSRLHAARH
jgi:hypothetical protein